MSDALEMFILHEEEYYQWQLDEENHNRIVEVLKEHNIAHPEGPRFRRKHGIIWKQAPDEDMYPIIRKRLDDYNVTWKLSSEELEKIYVEQVDMWKVFHYENSFLEFTDERKVRFCLNCKMYYHPSHVMSDVNINMCSEIRIPGETLDCFTKFRRGGYPMPGMEELCSF